MALSLLAMGILGSFPGWYTIVDDDGEEHEVRPFPSIPAVRLCLATLCVSAALGFVSILWLHVAAVAATGTLDFMFKDIVGTEVGTAAMSLGWSAVSTELIATLGVYVMVLSFDLLDRLTDEE